MHSGAIDVLQRHLRENPDDWEAWRVYGDFLTDQGDIRGRLIELVNARSAPSLTPDARAEMTREIESITEENSKRWLLGWSMPKQTAISWRFGFVTAVHFRIRGIGPALSLAAHPTARFLSGLSFAGSQLGEDDVRALASSPDLPGLLRLSFEGVPVSDLGARALAMGSLPSLTDLDLSRTALGAEGAVALSRASSLGSLRRLVLSHNPIRDGFGALARSHLLRSLVALGLGETQLRDGGARALAAVDGLDALAELDLHGDEISPKGARALAGLRSRALSQLRIGRNPLGSAGVAALAKGGLLRSLRELELEETNLEDDGIEALLADGVSDRLLRLNLRGNPLSDRSVERLASCEHLRQLRVLDLYGVGLTDAGVEHIAGSEVLSSIVRLHVGRNALTGRGFAAIERLKERGCEVLA